MNKEIYKKHGVTVSLVGASLVFGTMFGKCTVEPNLPTLEEPTIEEVAAPVEEPTIEEVAAPVEE
jgi:hypothetical protein